MGRVAADVEFDSFIFGSKEIVVQLIVQASLFDAEFFEVIGYRGVDAEGFVLRIRRIACIVYDTSKLEEYFVAYDFEFRN